MSLYERIVVTAHIFKKAASSAETHIINLCAVYPVALDSLSLADETGLGFGVPPPPFFF